MRASAALLALALVGCSGGDETPATGTRVLPVTITGPGRRHVFRAELADTAALQERGLMYRTDLKPDGGMLFHPYPAAGGGRAQDRELLDEEHSHAARHHLHP